MNAHTFPRRSVVACAAALLLSACIPSVHPYFTEADVVSDPRLEGDWFGDENARWSFTPEAGAYKLHIEEPGDDALRTGEFSAHLLKLGDGHFIDIVASDVGFAPDQSDLVAMSVFPGHLLIRVHQLEPELSLSFFNWDWLEEHLKAEPQALAHRAEDDRILLTATTAELQAFVLAHLAEGELFGDAETIARFTREPRPVAAPPAAEPSAPLPGPESPPEAPKLSPAD